ncbi:MAG: hypothetical protein PHN31_05155 [Candidatus Gracilibacteria bacterium]|nr:hypothetical protein [Candidatus Gracilibacteria bacterium]
MLVDSVYAADSSTSSIFGNTLNLGEFLLLIISVFILFASIATILFILRGGVLVILSGGKDDKIKPAINTIRYAFFGLVVMVATIFLFPIFGRILGIDVQRYAEPKAIFSKIEEIGTKIFGIKSSTTTIDNIDSIQDEDFINSL